MSQFGATHEMVVEHTYQGQEPDEQEPRSDAYEYSVVYVIRHPEDCWPDWKGEGERGDDCPISLEIQQTGIEDALGLNRWRSGRNEIEHLREGLYEVHAWLERYSSPEGTDWDGGLEWERKADLPLPPRTPIRFEERPTRSLPSASSHDPHRESRFP